MRLIPALAGPDKARVNPWRGWGEGVVNESVGFTYGYSPWAPSGDVITRPARQSQQIRAPERQYKEF